MVARLLLSSFVLCLWCRLPLQASVVHIIINPTTPVKVGTAQYQHFTATVTGTTQLAITWKVNGYVGGNAYVGTITTGGWYKGPLHIPSPATVSVSAVSVADPTKSASVAVTIVPGLPIISTSSLPQGTVGASYSAGLSAWNGTPPFTWRITIGHLPPGLSLLSSGAVVGRPTTAELTTTTIEVIDSIGKTASRPFNITIVPALILTVSNLPSFGSVVVGKSKSQTLTLSNRGSGSVTVHECMVTGAGFRISRLSLPLTLTAGQSTAFTVAFAPTMAGNAAGSISIVSNASNSPTIVPLSAAGSTLQLLGNPSSLSFGDVTVGSRGGSILPFLVTNIGKASVTISQASATGAGFSVSGPSLPLSLPSGQGTSFDVSFDPTTAGTVTGRVSVVSNASNSPTGASLSGTGVNKPSVVLSWIASTSRGVVGYNVYRGQVSGGPYTRANPSLLTATTYTDMSVQAGQTYYYVTKAVNSQGVQSVYSNEAVAVIPSP